MKNLFIAAAVIVASFVANNVMGQTTQRQVDSLATPVQTNNRIISDANTVNPLTIGVIEKMGGRRFDQTMITTSDSVTFWKGETIEGWHFGANVGGTQHGIIGGISVGYSEKWFDFDVTARLGQHEFQGQSFMAPSAFVEFKPTLVKWGKNNLQTNKLYAGVRVGYQFAKGSYDISEETDDYKFNYSSKQQGSGYAVGACIGWEKRGFMSPIRYGVQLSAHMYDMNWNYGFTSNGSVSADKVSQRGVVVEATVFIKFVCHKKAKNY